MKKALSNILRFSKDFVCQFYTNFDEEEKDWFVDHLNIYAPRISIIALIIVILINLFTCLVLAR